MADFPMAIADLLTPQTIRDRSQALFDAVCQGHSAYFACDLGRLPTVAAYVVEVIQANYPDLQIPFHSRWRHFEVDGVSRLASMEPDGSAYPPLERARMQFDLAVTSVLLDAGAGAQWQYREPGTGLVFRRSEGLAIASFHSFRSGLFSSQADRPWQADAIGLAQLTSGQLAEAFQVTTANSPVGLPGRVALLQKLGEVMARSPELFGTDNPRPGYLVDYLLTQAVDNCLPAPTVLQAVLRGFNSIWPGRMTLGGRPLGDVWHHPWLPDTGPGSQLVPFHKLSQWLTYSLLEPLQELGLVITHLDELTGLAEYRNGGLFIDLEVLIPQTTDLLTTPQPPDSPGIVEWRALTIILLDRLADIIRQQLHQTRESLPLAKILQGGTWAAGRQVALEKRPPQGTPPITLLSDGTVF